MTVADTETPVPAEPLKEATSLNSVIGLGVLWFIGLIILVMVWRWRCILVQLWSWYPPPLSDPYPPPPPPGMKKTTLQSLPIATYPSGVVAAKPTDCAICLTEFGDGDLMRSLPRCGHLFHVVCIDKWLVLHSSCPSCRQFVVIATDQKV